MDEQRVYEFVSELAQKITAYSKTKDNTKKLLNLLECLIVIRWTIAPEQS